MQEQEDTKDDEPGGVGPKKKEAAGKAASRGRSWILRAELVVYLPSLSEW